MSTKRISGFTFIKNGLTLGYPIKESIQSIEPLCDEVIINVGFDDLDLAKDDGTHDYLQDHFTSDKFKFVKSYWDPGLTSQGLILSQQTNIALANCEGKYCQYIQADEVIHEEDLSVVETGFKKMDKDKRIQGLVFDYIHFYGNVDAYLHTRRVYRSEVRAIKNNLGIQSHLDAQGFRHADNNKLLCLKIPARIFHYGWARKEQVMRKKIHAMDKLYHGQDFEQEDIFEYRRIWGIKKFEKTHPKVMQEWIEKHRNNIDIHKLKLDFVAKDVSLAISDFIENLSGYRIGEYKNYKLIK